MKKIQQSNLINLDFMLEKELRLENTTGAYFNSTAVFCNTKRKHGLLICPLKHLKGRNAVLVSSIDETVKLNGFEFNLNVKKYPMKYHTDGIRYIKDYQVYPYPKITYCMGMTELVKEVIMAKDKSNVLIKYTLKEGANRTILRIEPFLAFRGLFSLSKANYKANTDFVLTNNGISVKMYDEYPDVYFQTSKSMIYKPIPNWYYDIEYIFEPNKHDDFHEDLFVPGVFEIMLNENESTILSIGLEKLNATEMNFYYNDMQTEAETERRKKRPEQRIHPSQKNIEAELDSKLIKELTQAIEHQ